MSTSNADKSKALAAVNVAAKWFPPGAVFQVPANRVRQPAGKASFRLPAEFAMHFVGIDGVAPIVAGPIRYEFDEGPPPALGGDELVKGVADLLDHCGVRALPISPEVALFSRPALLAP